MTHTLFIKNMVCNRCKMAILNVFNNQNIEVKSIQLGKITIDEKVEINYQKLDKQLKDLGFEIIKDPVDTLIEKIKVKLIQYVENNNDNTIVTYLENEIGKSYTTFSKTFSKNEGITIEKYYINLKIEKVKELIQMQKLNFSEIAYTLNYKNSSHLAKQFKQITGMSMTDYKSLQIDTRKTLDKIV